MLTIQQQQAAAARENVEARAGTRGDLGVYLRSADQPIPAQLRGQYHTTDKGAVQLRGHYTDVVAPDAVRVARLPAAWMANGKIDCDAALAAGKGRTEFDAAFAAALDTRGFRSWY